MFISWRLWQRMAKPPRKERLFRHTVSEKPDPKRWVSIYQPLVDVAGTVGCGLLVVFVCCSLFSASFGVFVFGAIILLVLFNGAVFALPWGLMIAGMIADRRERGIWEVLCVTPGGTVIAVWSLLTGCLHRENTFEDRYWRHQFIVFGVALLGVMSALGSLAPRNSSTSTSAFDTLLILSIGLFAIAAGSYIDYIQSVTLGGLLGVYAALTTRNRFDAQLWFTTGYLSLQMTTYALTAVVGYVSLRLIEDASMGVTAGWIILLLLLFAVLREVILRGLVALLSWRESVNLLEYQ